MDRCGLVCSVFCAWFCIDEGGAMTRDDIIHEAMFWSALICFGTGIGLFVAAIFMVAFS
jgi:hypothetical protein